MPVDTSQLEFRYHGASEYKAYNKDTNQKDPNQARDENTGYGIYTIRCQVLFRAERQSGMITVRVPLQEPPAENMEFEHPVTFGAVISKTWNMEGRDGQTWTASTTAILDGYSAQPAADNSTSSSRKATKVTADAAA
ncbi:MAG: hypothetical protein ACRBK7_30355 [Acidimicrobiales bacterium]